MSELGESKAIRFTPVEIKLADVLFFTMRKNLMLFKDLEKKNIHYSIFTYGSTIDVHQTSGKQVKKHVPFAKIEFDWQFLLSRMSEELRADWSSICQIVKCKDPRWEDLEIKFLPIQLLGEFLSFWKKGIRWNINAESLQKLDSALSCSRLRDLADYGKVIGEGSGYLALSDGKDCLLFDYYKLNKILEKNLALSVRKIFLKYYTLGLIFWCVKIRLLYLRSDILNGKIPFRLHESLFLHNLGSLCRRI